MLSIRIEVLGKWEKIICVLFQVGNYACYIIYICFPGGSDGEESTCNLGDPGSIPGLGRSPGGEHGNPLQYSCLENPMDRGAWWATVHGIAELDTSEWLTLSILFIDKRLQGALLKRQLYLKGFLSDFLFSERGEWRFRECCVACPFLFSPRL